MSRIIGKNLSKADSGSVYESSRPSVSGLSWPRWTFITGFGLLSLFVLFWPTFESMVAIWWRSETFAHGFLVIPISAFLVWRKRRILAGITPRTDLRALALLILLGSVWMLAHLADVLVLQQLAFISMIPTMIWLLIGWPASKAIAFPLGFLFFTVPMGEALIYPLMNFTADFTVTALRLTGIPVYRQGTFFTIPTGRWSVVEGCSGVRYLIASVTLGCLYAYVTYHSYWRRIAFIALCTVAPIIANGLRAYMIVMIAHLSNMRLALGIDHYIYGWVFFVLVMMVLFRIGALWRDKEPPPQAVSPRAESSKERIGGAIPSPEIVLMIGLLGVMIWPAWGAYSNPAAQEAAAITLKLPIAVAPWQPINHRITQWTPHYVNPTAEIQQAYQNNQFQVGVYLAYYRRQKQGAELVNSRNLMVVQKHPIWRQLTQRETIVNLHGKSHTVSEFHLSSAYQDLLIWQWNWIAGYYTVNSYIGKLLEIGTQLFGKSNEGSAVVIYTPIKTDEKDARTTMQHFLDDMLSAIEARL